MKTNKGKVIIRIIIAVLLILVLFLITDQFLIRRLYAKKLVKSTFNSMTSGDYSEGFYYADVSGLVCSRIDADEWGYLALTKSDYQIKHMKLKWNSNEATVMIDMKYPDLYNAFVNKYSDDETKYTSEEINDILVDILEKGDYDKTESEFELRMVLYKGVWYIIDNEELMNVYTGGFYYPCKSIIEGKGE